MGLPSPVWDIKATRTRLCRSSRSTCQPLGRAGKEATVTAIKQTHGTHGTVLPSGRGGWLAGAPVSAHPTQAQMLKAQICKNSRFIYRAHAARVNGPLPHQGPSPRSPRSSCSAPKPAKLIGWQARLRRFTRQAVCVELKSGTATNSTTWSSGPARQHMGPALGSG